MYFRDIIGQDEAKQHLLDLKREGRIPHAMMFCGIEGTGKLPLAVAFARYLSCENPGPDDACGQLLLDTPYFSLSAWLKRMGAENQQAQIFVRESDEIARKLSLKSSQGGYKIMIIWLPEKMNTECGNKLLKLLEEPPEQTLFIWVTEAPDSILPTLQSRLQRFNLPPLTEKDLSDLLKNRYMLQPDDAADIAHRSEGSLLHALENIHLEEENKLFFELFTSLMRLAYARRLKEMKAWSEQVAALGRERQKNLLSYCQRMIRENFIHNFHHPEMNYLNQEEQQFSSRFAPFVSEKNVMGIMDELQEAQSQIEQNANPKFVFFDFALKMIVLLKQ